MISTPATNVTIIIESVRPGLKDVPSLLLFDDARHDATQRRNGQRRDERDGQSTDDNAFSSGGRSSSIAKTTTNKNKTTATPSSPPPAFCFLRVVRHPMTMMMRVPFCFVASDIF
jgi:hypothetical protein